MAVRSDGPGNHRTFVLKKQGHGGKPTHPGPIQRWGLRQEPAAAEAESGAVNGILAGYESTEPVTGRSAGWEISLR